MNRLLFRAKRHAEDLLINARCSRPSSNLARRGAYSSSHSSAPQVGFEISASVNGSGAARSRELQLLETALIHGNCDWIIGRSGKCVNAPYDCIHDVQIAEPLLRRVSIAHRLEMRMLPSPSGGGRRLLGLDAYRSAVAAWASELREVRGSLLPHPNKSPLSVISIPLQPIMHVCSHNNSNNWLDFAMELANETVKSLDLNSGEEVGYAVPIESLLSRDVRDAFRLDLNDLEFSSTCDLIGAIREHAKGLFLPMNCFTSVSCHDLLSKLRLPDTVKTFAVDTLRYHPIRPGFFGTSTDLAFSKDDFEAKHLPELRRSLDICMKFEKGYLTKFRDSGLHEKVRTTSVCLGHVIAAQFSESAKSSILTIDDWNFVRDNEVDPNFRAGLDIIKSTSKEAAEWAFVYEPIARRMLNNLEAVLQHKKNEFNNSLVDAIAQNTSFSSWSNYFASYACRESVFDIYCFPDKVSADFSAVSEDIINSAGKSNLGSIFEDIKLHILNHHQP